MSILQDYEKTRSSIDKSLLIRLESYLKEVSSYDKVKEFYKKSREMTSEDEIYRLKKEMNVILLDDVMLNHDEWSKFRKWEMDQKKNLKNEVSKNEREELMELSYEYEKIQNEVNGIADTITDVDQDLEK